VVPFEHHRGPALEDGVEDRGEVCLAEEVERLRRLGHSDEEIAERMGVDAAWVETLISPEEG
jgi:hypothetical protein